MGVEEQETLSTARTNTNDNATYLYKENTNGEVIERYLVPCPSADPADPLVWHQWRKHVAMVSTCFFVFMSQFANGSITPIIVPILIDFQISVAQATRLITLNILATGVGNLFWIPLAQKFGRRPTFIACSMLFFGSAVWCAVATSYSSLLGARTISGLAAAACEVLGVAIASDMYFLHERGTMVGLYAFMQGAGPALGSVFGGLVAHATPQWRWVFWMTAIPSGICMLTVFFLIPETNFRRPIADNKAGMTPTEFEQLRRSINLGPQAALSLTRWYDRETSLWKFFIRPILLLPLPVVLFASVNYGLTLGWVVIQATANSTAFSEIYNFSTIGVGNINIAALIGGIIGCLYGGPGSDYIVRWLSVRHRGQFEAEYRLWSLIGPFICGPIGLLLWGCGLGYQLDPYVAITGTGVSYGVVCAVATICITYMVDTYKPLSADVITILQVFRGVFAFAVSFAVTPWTVNSGFVKMSGYMTLIEGVTFATAVPLYWYGARISQWTVKKYGLYNQD
ncbi:putative MFS-type transporter [Cyphellophora attinorum]|uniref:Putative MFS-type transporter n=1 Tax=Cyphellophora attinorum TaxID=1664694 RepID=A0A0N1GYQ7_9EURO|nr:putative MFS-type transporter [Phialophora attinorum]KPI35977.1 putative MFS-type transporter [Phialophora attinorum]